MNRPAASVISTPSDTPSELWQRFSISPYKSITPELRSILSSLMSSPLSSSGLTSDREILCILWKTDCSPPKIATSYLHIATHC